MQKLEETIGYRFRNRKLLETALTHSSFANERNCSGEESYERLEFLGDSILGHITADFLYRQDPPIPEGRMTRLRAELVCEQSLHRIAQRLELGKYMRLGRGEERTHGRERPSILADMVESILAAMYLDSGSLEEPRRFILNELLLPADLGEQHRSEDYKTALQELVQRKPNQLISYEMLGQSGPDHDKTFVFRVLVNGVPVGEGSGRSKKEAEQMAAREALEHLAP
ncbi:MAG: ribonuclease III [Oscillospiraceae bacterium]|jgi:ribonuclease-3|nr:ribonuclease III [Oscillospiraceae bacterium]